MSQFQLMRQTTSLGVLFKQYREKGGYRRGYMEDLFPFPYRKLVASAVLYSCLVECVAVWVLCFNCGIG